MAAVEAGQALLLGDGGLLTVEWLGRVPYRPTWELQDELAERRRRREIGDRLLLLEHDPVYTIGRGGDPANMLATPERLAELGTELVRIDRGGDVTFHGPGQLVAYPIVELRDPLDLRRYVRALETAVIGTAAAFGVEADRVEGRPGVWVDGRRKLAAVGVRVKRGVTTHGLALNVSTDLTWFAEMIPCGIPDCEVTSLERETGANVEMAEVAGGMAEQLAIAFGVRLTRTDDRRAGHRASRRSGRSRPRRPARGRGVRAVADERVPGVGWRLDRRAGRGSGDGRRAGAHGPRGELGLRLHVIANSHGHIDHIFDNAPLKAASGAPLAIHPDDAYRLSGQNIYGYQLEPVVAEQELREGDRLAIGQLGFTVLHTPGHTEGSVCLYEPDRGLLLAGDVLFLRSYGRTDLAGGDDEQMVTSLTRLLREIPPETRVLPGHGPETTIGHESSWLERVAASGQLVIPGW